MDIDLLSKMVKELIMDHDRVALPGLGAFVAETIPASFSDKGYTINPPYRKLSFRPGEDDDGLLAALYASANDVGEELAAAAISDFITGLKEVLEKKKNVVFPGLGRLRATRENNVFFVSDEDLDIYPEGFGLEPVSLKTHVETKEEVSSALDSLKDMMAAPAAAVPDNDGNAAMADIAKEPDNAYPEKDETEIQPEETGNTAPEVSEVPDRKTVAPAVGETPEVREAPDMEVQEAQEIRPETAEVHQEEPEETPHQEKHSEEAGKSIQEEARPGTVAEDAAAGSAHRRLLYGVLITVAVLVLLLVLYVVVSRIFPEAVDSLLYNREDYEILHNISLLQN